MSEGSLPNPNVSLLARQFGAESVALDVKPVVIKSEDGSFPTLQRLAKEQAIVLFTPTMPSGTNYDPFEPLGRAIHSHHRKVRHIPYSLRDGYTYVHEAHLAEDSVGAVVVVVVVNGENVEEQNQFAACILQKTKLTGGRTPAVKVCIGKGVVATNDYGSAIYCASHDASQLKDVADVIFDRASGLS